MIPVYLDNDWEFEQAVSRKNANTGELEAAAGLAGLKFRFSATDGGPAIDASLEVAAGERSGTPGTYYAVAQGDDLRTYLATYIGKTIWEIFGDGTNVLTSIPRRVVERRRA